MRGHIFASYWIGIAVGFMIGAVLVSGLAVFQCESLQLPSVTMGDHSK